MSKVLPENFLGSLTNPVDLTTQAPVVANPFDSVLRCMAESSVIDMLAPVIFHYSSMMVDGARDAYQSTDKPMAVLSTSAFPPSDGPSPPVYTDPRRVARRVGGRRSPVGAPTSVRDRRSGAARMEPQRRGGARRQCDSSVRARIGRARCVRRHGHPRGTRRARRHRRRSRRCVRASRRCTGRGEGDVVRHRAQDRSRRSTPRPHVRSGRRPRLRGHDRVGARGGARCPGGGSAGADHGAGATRAHVWPAP